MKSIYVSPTHTAQSISRGNTKVVTELEKENTIPEKTLENRGSRSRDSKESLLNTMEKRKTSDKISTVERGKSSAVGSPNQENQNTDLKTALKQYANNSAEIPDE